MIDTASRTARSAGRAATVDKQALVRAALNEITNNYRQANLSSVAHSYRVSLAYVSECVRAETGKTYKELLQQHRLELAEVQYIFQFISLKDHLIFHGRILLVRIS